MPSGAFRKVLGLRGVNWQMREAWRLAEELETIRVKYADRRGRTAESTYDPHAVTELASLIYNRMTNKPVRSTTMADSVIASVTIQRAGAMTPQARKEIAAWLRKQAGNLVKRGSEYNDTGPFNARYYQAKIK
jgi:hypothetical protein